MAVRNNTIYSINDIRKYVDYESFGIILDDVNAKYNEAIWRRYASWGTPTDDKNWVQGTKETPILVRASILGTHSTKPQRNTTGWGYYGGSVPKMGHGFSIEEDDLFEIRKAAKLQGRDRGELVIDSLISNLSNIVGGVHNELTYMTLQALSKGEISDQSVDGGKYDFKFPIPDNHFIAPETKWWKKDGTADETMNVVQDILDMQRLIKKSLYLSCDHWKMSQTLLDKLVAHPSVIKTVIANRNYFNTSSVAISEADVLTALHAAGVWPFDVIDHKSAHEEDGISVLDEPAFDEHNMVAANSAITPFTMKCTNSIYLDRQAYGHVAANNEYHLIEDRIAVLNTWNERPIQNIVDVELYAGPVFNNLREFVFAEVWAKE